MFYILFPAGYKGYGLCMMVEIFCGILSGANFGPNIRQWRHAHREANLVSFHRSIFYLDSFA